MNTTESTIQPTSNDYDYYKHAHVLYIGNLYIVLSMDLSCTDWINLNPCFMAYF